MVADRSAAPNTDSAVGLLHPVETTRPTQMAIAERWPIVVPQATENPLTASAHEVLSQRGREDDPYFAAGGGKRSHRALLGLTSLKRASN